MTLFAEIQSIAKLMRDLFCSGQDYTSQIFILWSECDPHCLFSHSLSNSKLIGLLLSHQYEMLEIIPDGNIYGVNRLKL